MNNSHEGPYNSPNYLFNDTLDANMDDFSDQTAPPKGPMNDPNNFLGSFGESSAPNSSSDSQTNSADTSEVSFGDLPTGKQDNFPGQIAIPADGAEQRSSGERIHASNAKKEDAGMGNDFFDFESAGSSPIHYVQQLNHGEKMPYRPAHNVNAPNLGYGPPVSEFDVREEVAVASLAKS